MIIVLIFYDKYKLYTLYLYTLSIYLKHSIWDVICKKFYTHSVGFCEGAQPDVVLAVRLEGHVTVTPVRPVIPHHERTDRRRVG